MKISEVKTILQQSEEIKFELPDGTLVPTHFHVTEVGKIHKHFIDCGGTVRTEESANFQLWSANDYNHRLEPGKLRKIIQLSERVLELGDLEIEVEYQGTTIEKYGLAHNGSHFLLTSKQTDCLAQDACGVPAKLEMLAPAVATCTPGGSCC